jgi:hypothetical protein
MKIPSSVKILFEDGQTDMANFSDGILQLFIANAPNSIVENI